MLRKVLALAVLLAVPVGLQAQTANASAQVTVGSILEISVTNLSIDFGTITASGYATTATQSVVSHTSNVTHTVQVTGSGTHFTSTSGTNDAVKPIGELEWSLDGSSWSALTGSAADLHTSAAAGAYASDETVSYRVMVNATDPADTYTVNFTYSVIAG